MNKIDTYNLSLILLLLVLVKFEEFFEIGLFFFPLFIFIYYVWKLLGKEKSSQDDSKMLMLNTAIKTLFGIGLIFIFYEYPGKDAISLAFMIIVAIAAFYSIGNDKVIRSDKYAIYIYLNFYILCYFAIPDLF